MIDVLGGPLSGSAAVLSRLGRLSDLVSSDLPLVASTLDAGRRIRRDFHLNEEKRKFLENMH